MSEHHHQRRMALEHMCAHLARAASELEDAQRFLDAKSGNPFELDVVRAVANARISVSDALETIRLMMEQAGG